MTRATPPGTDPRLELSADDERRVLHNIDRIEDRLRDAPEGLHAFGSPAEAEALAASPLPPAARLLWAQWDGLELAAGELRLWSLAELGAGSEEPRAEGRLRADDLAVGERGGDLLVLCGDPHAEGADVVRVDEDGDRLPHSTGVDLLVLAVFGEVAVLYDEEGEFQEELFGPDGQLTRGAERRLLRRHLDLDPDAPLARFKLAQSLRRAGELRAAAGELRQLLRRAPDFAWGQHEQGRVSLGLGAPADALRAFVRASELVADPGVQGYFLAWACVAAEAAVTSPEPVSKDSRRKPTPLPTRAALAAQVLARSPEFARAQEAALREALEVENAARADEALQLGLAVMPGHVGLLSLRPAVDDLRARPVVDEADDLDDADREIAAARAEAEADDDLVDGDAPPTPRVHRPPPGPAKGKAAKGGRKPPTRSGAAKGASGTSPARAKSGRRKPSRGTC